MATRGKDYSRRRTERIVAEAYEIPNPLDGLGQFTSFGLRVPIVQEGRSTKRHRRNLKIEFKRSPLSREMHGSMLRLFERNMGDLYRSSSWGLNLRKKSKEFKHKNARFLVVTEDRKENEMQGEEWGNEILAFSHFRFEKSDETAHSPEALLYVFELQLHELVRRRGLGRHLMLAMEAVAERAGLDRVMLTVFKNNSSAMDFYLKRMRYSISDCSPSRYEGEESAEYEILDKRVSTGYFR